MDFDKIHELALHIPEQKEIIRTEDATKMTFVLPFINALGYNIFNPMEVVPEYIIDEGGRKDENADFAIFKESKPIILVECKLHNKDLNNKEFWSQLRKYYNQSSAKFGILTNGIIYKFYSDLDEINKMDKQPFLELNLLNVKDPIQNDPIVGELKYFVNPIDADKTYLRARQLKYMKEIRLMIEGPSEDLIRFIAREVYNGSVTEKVVIEFSQLFTDVFNKYIKDKITQAMDFVPTGKAELETNTTQKKLEAYFIIKTLLNGAVEPDQIIAKDSEKFLDVIYDDSESQKVLCRLYLNDGPKYLGFFDANGNETKTLIDSIDDLYAYSDQIVSLIRPNDEKSFIFQGQTYKIKLWKDMLPKVCAIMVDRHKDIFEKILNVKGRKHIYFSRNAKEFKYAEKIDGTDIFVNTNYGPYDQLNISKKVITEFGYLKNDIQLDR